MKIHDPNVRAVLRRRPEEFTSDQVAARERGLIVFELRRQGHSARELATVMGISPHAVRLLANRWTPEKAAAVVKKKEDRASEIAQKRLQTVTDLHQARIAKAQRSVSRCERALQIAREKLARLTAGGPKVHE